MTQVILTSASTSPWSRPADWVDYKHQVELLGAGGQGGTGSTGTTSRCGAGGGGGAYYRLTDPVGALGSTTAFAIAAQNTDHTGNATASPTAWEGTSVTDSYTARSGQGGGGGGLAPSPAAGGTAIKNGTPSPVTYTEFSYAGGAGGTKFNTSANHAGGSGGGGAAGPNGVGGRAGNQVTAINSHGATGGGGSNGGANGGDVTNSTTPSAGGNGRGGTGSGAAGTSGSKPGGAGGAGTGAGGGGGFSEVTAPSTCTGGAGGTFETIWSGSNIGNVGTSGGGGGGGGCSVNTSGHTSAGGNAGNYGSGGGGSGGTRNATSTRTAGDGGGGLIIISYGPFAIQTLLLHGEGTDASVLIKDSSFQKPHGVTVVGNTQIDTAQSKFGGSSILFDGTGDYLKLDGHGDFHLGTGDFTIDFWVRFVAVNTQYNLIDFRVSDALNVAPFIWVQNDNTLRASADEAIATGTTTLVINTWYHVALTRSSGNIKLFLNGTQEGSTFSTAKDFISGAGRPHIGASHNGSTPLNGWIDELRVLKGVAVWTANFTAPTYPYATPALLLHADGSDGATTFTDSSGRGHVFTANGNAQLDTAQSKFGTASILFDGTGDYLSGNAHQDFEFGSGDFTIDFWVRFNAVNAETVLYDGRPDGVSGLYPTIYMVNTNTLRFFTDSANRITGTTTLTTATWYHIALTRSGTSTRLFLNGTQEGSTYTDSNNYRNNGANRPIIGGSGVGPNNFILNGWIDELRVVKGFAVWTANFTSPTTAYDADPSAHLLLHGDGADASTVIVDSAVATVGAPSRTVGAHGNTQLDTAQFKFGASSMLFDGTGDKLQVGPPSDYALGAGDFTIDCWIRLNVTGQNQVIASTIDVNDGDLSKWVFYISNSNVLKFDRSSSGFITGTTALSSGTWYHVALTRASGNVRAFLNGVQEGSTYADGGASYTAPAGLTIGISHSDTSPFNGWIDEFRVLKGTAHWTSNFLPWPVAYDAPANVLLLHANGADATRAFPDNNDIPRAHKITVNGNAQIDTAQSKFGGSSLLFDGTGDYLTLDGSSDFAFGTGDFTIDFWVRINATGTTHHLFDCRPASTNGLYPDIHIDSSNHVIYYVNGDVRITGTTALTTGTWYHVAITRSGTSTKLFVNGTQEGSTYTDSNNYLIGASRPMIGGNGFDNPGSGVLLNGWLDEIRVKRGEAVWTSNFSPPSSAYAAADGHLLIHGDGADGSQTMIADEGKATGKTDIIVNADAQVDTAQQKFGTASALFDGTGDYLNVA